MEWGDLEDGMLEATLDNALTREPEPSLLTRLYQIEQRLHQLKHQDETAIQRSELEELVQQFYVELRRRTDAAASRQPAEHALTKLGNGQTLSALHPEQISKFLREALLELSTVSGAIARRNLQDAAERWRNRGIEQPLSGGHQDMPN